MENDLLNYIEESIISEDYAGMSPKLAIKMDVDIDIEEHDVLDNPAIRDIFPDISILKEEMCTFDEKVFNESVEVDNFQDIKSKSENKDFSILNTILLDTTIEPINHTEINTSAPDITFVDQRQPPFLFKNKIILGSKPKQKHNNINAIVEKHTKLQLVNLSINDIGPKLEKSKCFCKICQILFAHIEDIEKHMKDYHDTNVKNIKEKIKCNQYKCHKCDKYFLNISSLNKHCTSLHKMSLKNRRERMNRRISIGSQLAPGNKSCFDSKTVCFHCKKTFLSRRLLIKHIYEVIQNTKNTNGTKSRYIHKYFQKISKVNCKEPEVRQINGKVTTYKRKIKSIEHKKSQSIYLHRCLYCSYYLKTYKKYINHLRNKHRDTSLIKSVKVPFDEYCKYCEVKCKNKYFYNRHIYQEHKERVEKTFKIQPIICIPKVDFILTKTKKVDFNDCDNIRSEQVEDDVHDTDSMDMDPIENTVMVTTDVKSYENITGLLKDVLFKCKRCDIYFLSAKTAKNHSEHMEMLINWKCAVCLKIFKKEDEDLHLIQHKFTDNFTVMELNENELARILYKCSKCAIHFNELGYFNHFKQCGKFINSKSMYCKTCDKLISHQLGKEHQFEHKMKSLCSSDYHIVNSDPIEKGAEEKTEQNVFKETKKLPVKNKKKSMQENVLQLMLKMCYCATCKCFISLVHKHTVHVQQKCGHLASYVCKYCGLMVTSNAFSAHKKLHQGVRNYKLQDYSFYDMKNGHQTIPPIPEYPKCDVCNVRFISKFAITNHDCTECDFLTCPFCNDRFSENIFKLHLTFHNYTIKPSSNNMQRHSPIIYSEQNDPEPDDDILNEIKLVELNDSPKDKLLVQSRNEDKKLKLEKRNGKKKSSFHEYSSSQATLEPTCSDMNLFHVIYSCTECFLTLNAFDKVVEHCQEHIFQNIQADTDTCKICKLRYDMKHKEDHNNFHNLRLSKKTLTIIKFDAFCFAVDYKMWIEQMFLNIDKGLTQSILNRSIYKTEGRIKMQIIQQGRVDLTVYKCGNCQIFIDLDNIYNHVDEFCSKLRKHPCTYCGLPFLTSLSRMEHERLHYQKDKISLESYRIVSFNQRSDKSINKAIRSSRNYVLYQCRLCGGIVNKGERSNHKCNGKPLKKCVICGLLFYNSDYNKHVSRHEIFSSFTQETIKIVLFGRGGISEIKKLPQFAGVVADYTLYKCTKCELCIEMTKEKTIKHDSKACKSTKRMCSKCNLFVLKHKFNNHCKMHDNDVDFCIENMNIIPYTPKNVIDEKFEFFVNNQTEIQNTYINDSIIKKCKGSTFADVADPAVSERSVKLYKCSCGLHFLDSISIKSHFGHCNIKTSKQNCSKCDLLFTPDTLFTHLIRHHGDKKYLCKFDIIKISKRKNQIVILHKCNKCELHFLERQAAKEHFDNCQKTEVKVNRNECNVCRLVFDDMTLAVHKENHHLPSVADIDIVEVEMNEAGNTNVSRICAQ